MESIKFFEETYGVSENNIQKIIKDANLSIELDCKGIADYFKCINIERELKRINSGITLDREDIFLEMLVKNYKIFIDTCSLVEENSHEFFKKLEIKLLKYNKQVYIPLSVVKEIEKIIKEKNKKSMVKGKHILYKYQQKNLLCILDDKGQNFADNVFSTVFTIHRLKYNL
ncbi:hypothetical protein, partial [Romboutsia sp.]|uniref:hypothetical protein n=1 Tax=Romboutsia sp. TaxID=1965302 RepID=UPI003F3E9588